MGEKPGRRDTRRPGFYFGQWPKLLAQETGLLPPRGVAAGIAVTPDQSRRHCEPRRGAAIQSGGPGSPQRFALRDDV